jgi:hypothetical protein
MIMERGRYPFRNPPFHKFHAKKTEKSHHNTTYQGFSIGQLTRNKYSQVFRMIGYQALYPTTIRRLNEPMTAMRLSKAPQAAKAILIYNQ